MFADRFLENDEVTEKSLVDYILMTAEETKEKREVSREELDCIITVIGNFALDGIDAREKLCRRVISSQFLSWVQGLIV